MKKKTAAEIKREEIERKLMLELELYIMKEHISPTVRELAVLVGLKSSSTAMRYLNKLKDKGEITWNSNSPRTIRVLKEPKNKS